MDNDQGGREGGEGRVPRGLSLEQAYNLRRDRQLDDLTTRMDELMRMMQQGMQGNRRNNSPSPVRSVHTSNHEASSDEEVHHPRHRQPPRDDDRGLRLDLPDFDGAMKPEKFLEWLQRMERVFDYKDYDDAKRFKIAILKLIGYASLWYENLKNKRRKDGKPSLCSWEKLKTRMKKRFLPSDFTQDMFRKLQVLQQHSLSVEEYVVEFEKINMLCDVDEKAEHKIARFIAGLDKKLAKKCYEAKKYVKAKKASTFKPFVKQGEKTYGGAKKEEGSTSTSSTKFDKFKGDKGKTSTPLATEERHICFKCKGYGHILKDCPNNRVMTLRDIQEIDDEYAKGNFEEEEHEGEKEHDDEASYEVDSKEEPVHEGQQLIVRRMLHTQPTLLDHTQRDKIFFTRCLTTSHHPRPYKLNWLSDDNGIKVTKQALILFEIGKFKDEVLCDVCNMDACHILLGRPWQYDRHVKYDGRTNVCIATVGGKRTALKPLTSTHYKKNWL
ncbi:uncharacterized protein LOC104907794 [Beta vulgaris subsp. vulgaris]|uniref:uncharacterized protein LOC104907794 n=1 Tax=Beta vulgaris subsp. vulgaris TaxID=3555 RepID=UPI00053F47C5|nr:uncharacterized protein LOC104907794 [Beta vulgaris subsp. vulgaris]